MKKMKYEGENNYVRMNMAKKKGEICGEDDCVRVEEGMGGEIYKIIFLLIDKVFFFNYLDKKLSCYLFSSHFVMCFDHCFLFLCQHSDIVLKWVGRHTW